MQTLKNYVKQGGFYKAVVEDGSDIIFICHDEGKILYHNNSVRETLGYSGNSLVNKKFFQLHFTPLSSLESFQKAYLASTKKI
ncbi:MAG: PAS domain S-box protein [Cyclobacteriaceae bacterium]